MSDTLERFDIRNVTEDNVAHWMHNHGHIGYLRKIRRINKMIGVLQAKSTKSAPGYERKVRRINKMIDVLQEKKTETLREAYDRYQDWVTDPLD